ncbi:MAG: pyridoxamine 5'-phosphate oxidase family protein [Desulfobacterales bacterium]
MTEREDTARRIKDLCKAQKLAVLCTQSDNQPYASLMAFFVSPDLKRLYLITPKDTRKFQNLAANPRVAVLVTSSENKSSDFKLAMAATVIGNATEVSGPGRRRLIDRYLEKHPHLEEFATSPSSALIEVAVETYVLVEKFQQVSELHLKA